MGVDNYFTMSKDELLMELITSYIARPIEGKQISEALVCSEKYKNDFEFRIVVDAAKSTLLSLHGDYNSVVPLCVSVLERATAYQMWKVISLIWNTLGTTYFMLGMLERAVECFFNTIDNDRENGISWFAPSAYNNIGLIYMKLGDDYGAQEYFKLAFDSLEDGGNDQPRYLMKKMTYLCDMALELAQTEGLEAAKLILDEIAEFDFKEFDDETIFSFYYASMYYYFYAGDTKQGEAFYLKCRNNSSTENPSEFCLLLCSYVELCEMAGLPVSKYKKELLEIGSYSGDGGAYFGSFAYKRFRDYYKETGDEAAYLEATENYILKLEEIGLENQTEKLNSVKLISALKKESGTMKKIRFQNKELKMMAEEAELRKNELQETYQRIERISILGNKLTSSLDLNEVVELISKIIKENVPFEVFCLVVVDKEKGVFTSLYSYFDGEKQEQIEIALDDPTSVMAYCYKEKRIVFSSEEILKEKLQAKEAEAANNEDLDVGYYPSAIFFPLIASEEVIGIFTIQHDVPDFYTEKDIKFLKDLSPYLSIALNNAMKSWELEKEIESHLSTRSKLEKANRRLERISSLDGLTEINGRRVFDAKIVELIHSAALLETSLAVFMIDIDNFKLYNDNYGHLEGDEVLKTVAQLFRAHMDEISGLSARFGGEEFIGACLGLDYRESFAHAEKIRKAVFDLNIPHSASGTGRLTISIGVAVAREVSEIDKSGMMKMADECLYKAKHAGKNQVVGEEFVG